MRGGARIPGAQQGAVAAKTDEEHRAATPDSGKNGAYRRVCQDGNALTQKVQRAETEHWTPRAVCRRHKHSSCAGSDAVPCAAIPLPIHSPCGVSTGCDYRQSRLTSRAGKQGKPRFRSLYSSASEKVFSGMSNAPQTSLHHLLHLRGPPLCSFPLGVLARLVRNRANSARLRRPRKARLDSLGCARSIFSQHHLQVALGSQHLRRIARSQQSANVPVP